MFFDCLTFPDSIRTPQPECRIHLLSLPVLLVEMMVLLTCSLTVSRFRTQSGPHNQNAGFISFSLPFLLWSLWSRDNVLLTCSLTVSRFRTQSGLHNQNAGFISFRYHSSSLRWCSFDMFFDCLTFPDSIRTPQPECRIHLLFVTIPPFCPYKLPQLWRKNRKEREKKEEKGESRIIVEIIIFNKITPIIKTMIILVLVITITIVASIITITTTIIVEVR